jgi:hypothetical protein
MNYCLNKEEFPLFFDAYLNKNSLNNSFDEELQMRIDACMNWEDKIGIMLYIFTHFLQKKSKVEENVNPAYIQELFKLSEAGNFVIETLNRDFITYMLDYSRFKIEEDLSDSLVFILQNYLDRTYDSSLCF